jgi:hypothetical protein
MPEHSDRSLLTSDAVLAGVVAGLVHAGVAIVLWNRWFDDLAGMLAAKPLNGVYLLVGMFLLGFVPALLYVGGDVLSPAAVVAAFLVPSAVGSWLLGPVRSPSAAPTPFSLYVLLWVAVVALAGVAGGVERRRRQPDAG